MAVNTNAVEAGIAFRGLDREEVAAYLGTTVTKFEKKLATGKLGSQDIQRLQELIRFGNPETVFYADFAQEASDESRAGGCTLSFLPV